ncbi:MAG: urate hydroxylase PuuD, partial [Acidobacteriota bacterium]
MDPNVNAWLEMLFRWIHVVAGIAWIGHLYFFNFVNAQVARTYDGDSKRKVVPELMPRALYWFRWGAAWTWISGILLAGLIYYMTPNLLPPDSTLSVPAGT